MTLCYALQWLLIGNIATAVFQAETLLHWALWVVTIVTATTLLERLVIFVRRVCWPKAKGRGRAVGWDQTA